MVSHGQWPVLSHYLCLKEVVTMDMMRAMDMKVAEWVHQWEDVVEEAMALVMGPHPLRLESMVATLSLLSSCCTAWTHRRWTLTASSISSVSMATWSVWVFKCRDLYTSNGIWLECSICGLSSQVVFVLIKEKPFSFHRLNSWKVNLEQPW